jgi:hypothetical protein
MSRLESILEEARKLQPEERRQLAARLLEEGDTSSAARQDERLEAMRAAASDELFLDDLTATTEEWEAALDDFADSPAFSKAISLVDDSRAEIYREREDSQL